MHPSLRPISLALGVLILTAVPACHRTKPSPPPPPADPSARWGVPVPAPAKTSAPERLLPSVTPLAYALTLTLLPERPSFSGEVRIQTLLTRPRREIFLHGRGLRVSAASVRLPRGTRVRAQYTQVAADGRARLDLPRMVGPGRVTLELAYSGDFGKRLRGIYRVRDGGRDYVFTHFQPSSARRGFPSFDEPGFKTPFDISLVVRRDHVAVSNSPVAREEKLAGGLKRVVFRRTARLPSYLVALAVGPFDVVDGPPVPANRTRKEPLPLRGIATRGKGKHLAYALASTGGLVRVLEEYFGIPYPYAKLDLIAVPDFTFGAMENAGAITFAESYLLLDDASDSARQRDFASLAAHELAHQWFGNLVTMRWWDDTWLSESFATWVGSRAVDTWRPAYRSSASLLREVLHAMGMDSLGAARPIRQPIHSAHDVFNAFDALTYDKGGGVLAMFERFLGRQRFRAGLRRYLRRYRFGNATADDLLRSLSAAAARDVAGPFRTFLVQPGVPLVRLGSRCEGGRGRVSLTQQRWLPLGSRADALGVWQIPVCLRFGKGARRGRRCVLLKARHQELALPVCPDWIHPNAHGSGYYRFEVPRRDLVRLAGAVKRLDPLERLVLADSVQAALARGALEMKTTLGVLASLLRTGDPLLLTAPLELLEWMHDHLVPSRMRPRVRAYIRELYHQARQKLGFTPRPTEGPLERITRRDVLTLLGEYGRDPQVRAEAKRRAAALLGFRTDGKLHQDAVAPELVRLVLLTGLDEWGAPFFEALRRHLIRTDDARFRLDALRALASTRAPEVVRRARAFALGPSLRVSELGKFVAYHLRDQRDHAATWAWLEKVMARLGRRMPIFLLGRLPLYLMRACDEGLASRAERFLGPRVTRFPGGPRSLRQALETIRLCARRVRAQRESALRFFANSKM